MAEATNRSEADVAAKLLSDVMVPAEEAHALPFAAYRDDDFFALEMEHIFRSDWVAVCAEAALAESGACLATNIGGEPIALIRGKDGTLRALSNACRHQGAPLLIPGANRLPGDRIVCPYHAWTYDDTGTLLGATFARADTIGPGTHSLPSFSVDVWMGVVFVCLAQNPQPLGERLAGIAPRLAEFDMQAFTVPAPLTDPEVWSANWKLVVENGMERSHLFQVHANTLEKITPTRSANYIDGSAAWTLAGGGIVQYGGYGFRGGLPSRLFESAKEHADHYVLVSIPPSFVGVATNESWDWLAVHPLSPVSTCVFTGTLTKAKPGINTKSASCDYVNASLDGDRAICERIQSEMPARASSGGRLASVERIVADFHHYLGWRMLGEEPPPRHLAHEP